MTAVASDTAILSVHTDTDGKVWFADGDRVPIGSGLPAAGFVEALQSSSGRMRVRLLGTHANAQLIMLLHRCCHDGGSLEVASPLIGGTPAEQVAPEEVLFRMRQCRLPASLGGWHKVSHLDYPAYALVHQYQLQSRFSAHVEAHLKVHPAWPALKFVSSLWPEYAAILLADVLDPRWFIDRRHTDRVGKLQAHLGLTPANMARAVAGDTSPGPVYRCRVTMLAWSGQGPPTETNSNRPGDFLWRIFNANGGGAKGFLRASQKFVVFLRHTWLQTLSGHPELFVPERLFKRPDEILAYKAHISACAGSV